MSSSNPSDPRLLLPEWLRDGDAPVALKHTAPEPAPETRAQPIETAAPATVTIPQTVTQNLATPYSDRLSLDTRLDPDRLISAEDLPRWLGGIEKAAAATAALQVARTDPPPVASVPDEPEPYDGVDAPQDGVVDIEVNGWILVAAAIGLLVLLLGAIRLYLSA